MTPNTESAFLNRDNAARYLGLSIRQFDRMRTEGAFRFHRLGRRCLRFRRADLDAAMERFAVGAPEGGTR